MIAWPEVEKVVAALEERGAERRSLKLVGPHGPTTIHCLFRRADGEEFLSQPLPESSRMTWVDFDNLCLQLGLDPRSVDLGLKRPPSWWENPTETLEN